MKSFAQKKEELSKINEKISKAKLVVFSSFARVGEKGLAVSDMRALKKNLREVDSEYIISKKTIFNKTPGINKAGVDVFQYGGSMGVAIGYGDAHLAAKQVYNFSKKNQAFKLFGAILSGKLMSAPEFMEFAKLPSKEIMIARLLGMVKYPLSALANVLDQISKKKSV
ncbi:MAG: 50S ribosomal protein L10 [Candidatus Yanofskybacteria bacterium]|nr:50S ribosomal protein L10 [Candidatus Yanofskybacteria bacterium]